MLRIHRAERADRLAGALASVLAEPLDDPLVAEVVAVPTRGVERWLAQVLSGSLGVSSRAGAADGVCANVEFPFPGRLVGGAVATATGVERDTDPWLPERAAWPLLEAVEEALDEPWLAPLAAHLGRTGSDPDEQRRSRRLSTVRHLADLFDRYGVHRPAMVRAWAAGGDGDGRGQALAADALWQPELWRRLRTHVGTPSPAERLEDACERIRKDPGLLVDLPRRVSLFGLTRLPASYLDILHAVAEERDVHLFLLHPSPALWARIEAMQGGSTGARRLERRSDDVTASEPRNPLLASWGRDAREMQLVLTAHSRIPEGHSGVSIRTTPGDQPGAQAFPSTLLERIQDDVRADRPPPGHHLPGEERRAVLEPADRSVQVHACHGRARQVEIVRDAILHLLADDPTLEPRDVIVMCPDIESFAPLIHATFGMGEHAGGVADEVGDEVPAGAVSQFLPVRLADRSLRQTNPVLGAVDELLGLADARLTASQVVDFASRDPVRRRFRLDDDDLARMGEWVASTGIRWGLDAAFREPYGLGAVDANTWRTGFDRMLVGVTTAEEGHRLMAGVLPLDDVDSGDIDLAGNLAELLDRLAAAVAALTGARPVHEWTAAIAEAADMLTATTDTDAWQRAQLQGMLDDVVAEATAGGRVNGAPLVLAEVRALLADRLRGRPTRANFRTGHLTMCTLVPMRSVPHRVVCLLGLDDGVFPRKMVVDGDDLVQLAPYVGDRDPRSEDRQLLLDALLAATSNLVVTYTGRDERTNAVRPPAVPVGELLDVVDRTVCTIDVDDDGVPVPARSRVVVHHPLQPFDRRNFAPGGLVHGRPWSFDVVALDGARASLGDRAAAPVFLAGPLPPIAPGVVQLDDLVRFVQHPVKAFLRQRLGVYVSRDEDELADGLPVEPGPLEKWHVGNRLLEARLAGAEADVCRAAEVARGTLPPGALGGPVLDGIVAVVEGIVAGAAAVTGAGTEPGPVEVEVDLGGGRSLVGTVPGVTDAVLSSVSYSNVGPKHRLASWARLLALTAAHPERPFEAVTVGRGSGRAGVMTVRIPPLAADAGSRRSTAVAHLSSLVDLYERGMREPLPLACATSAAYAEAVARRRDPAVAARPKWVSEWEWPKEDSDLEHQLVYGGVVAFERLLEAPPCDGEDGLGWAVDDPTRFGRLALRLWLPLLSREKVSR
ncbi:MAG: exodeoxyribonuclease V subunit gamma [Acidimicrobiales bacterium]